MLIHGDCKIELQKLDNNFVDLVYLDPPFFTQKKQALKNSNNKEYSFEDSWENINSYRHYIQERLEECKKILKNTGSIFLHCDRSASHYLRIALDAVFGRDNFQSEIIWSYKRWSNAKKGLLHAHQVIFFYSKGKNFKFNPMYTNYSPTTNLDQIFQKRVRNEQGKTVYKVAQNGGTELIEEKKGVPLSDVWDIPYLNPKAKERVGYPTQKPILLLERIIKLVTDEEDLVLDPFCGSGTTLVAAKLLKRNFIGIDQSEEAMKLSEKRLATPFKTESGLLKKGKDSYINQDPKITEILHQLQIIPVQRNKGIDGFLKIGDSFKPVPIKIQRANETLENSIQLLLQACNNNGYQKKVLIKTNKLRSKQLFSFNQNFHEDLIIINNIDDFCNKKKQANDLNDFLESFSSNREISN